MLEYPLRTTLVRPWWEVTSIWGISGGVRKFGSPRHHGYQYIVIIKMTTFLINLEINLIPDLGRDGWVRFYEVGKMYICLVESVCASICN